MTPRHALWALIALSMALRLTWAASLGPGNDEAYHYLFAVHPDWSYFDHPPMLAVVERVGLMLNSIIGGQADSVLGLRLGFILLFAGSTWLMARLGTRIYSEWAGFFAAFLLNVSAYHTAAAGAFGLATLAACWGSVSVTSKGGIAASSPFSCSRRLSSSVRAPCRLRT